MSRQDTGKPRPNLAAWRGENGFGIIADDLTGATDAAAAFALAGFRATVVLHPRNLGGLTDDVVALSTNSRHDPPSVARGKVTRACHALTRAGRTLLYKKIDSTVQGNIVAEVDAARRAGGFRTALVCPANPRQGRIVRDGMLIVRGQSLIGLEQFLDSQNLKACGMVPLPLSIGKVVEVMHAWPFSVAEAATERDLAILAWSALHSAAPVLLAGSAGLAGALARVLSRAHLPAKPEQIQAANEPAALPASAGPTLILSGSKNPVTQEQLAVLRKCTGAEIIPLSRACGPGVRSFLAGDGLAVVHVQMHRRPESVLLRNLGFLKPLLRKGRIGNLLLIGGDTALRVCRVIRADAVAIHGEILPGLAWGRIIGGLAHGRPVCTKPGGFGTEMDVAAAVRFFAQRE